MQRYILQRVLQAAVALLAVSIIVFFLSHLTGDPLDVMLPIDATKEDYEAARRALGLDRPLPVQYGIFLVNAAQGDFGTSIRVKKPVRDLILDRLPSSVKLAAASLGLSLLIALPLGVVSAVRKGSVWDAVARVFAFLGQAMPPFWVGLVLMRILSVRLGWLPPAGAGGPSYYVMPAFVMGWLLSAGIVRLLRSAMLEVLDSEFVRLARMKGVSEAGVIWKHALRNALVPVVTFAGYYGALLIGSAVVVETVFSWPGIGRLTYDALIWRDFPVIQGVVMVVAGIVILINLTVDVLYAYIDPRIRYEH